MASIYGLGFQAPHFAAVASDFIGKALQSIANAVTNAVKNFFAFCGNFYTELTTKTTEETGDANMYAREYLPSNR